jgi:lysyl-tRNA synthetase, class II
MVASKFWQIDSLYRFNDKFKPTWQPRFVSFESARDLPRIAIAVLEAEGFLRRPPSLRRTAHRP